MERITQTFMTFGWSTAVLLIAAAIGFVIALVALKVASRATVRTRNELDNFMVRFARKPLLFAGPLLGVNVVLPSLELESPLHATILQVLSVALIAAVAWLLIQVTRAFRAYVESRYSMEVSDNLSARTVNTQVLVLQRTAVVIIIIIATAAALMTIPQVRQLGTSLLASAGLAGLVAGIAARPVLSNLIAGIQLALTQPIRLDDVVIVNNEWGRIEEILSTYVVVRIWDQRRLIVPLSHFVEQPFQNWTRTRADILGTVMIHVDYTVPVDRIRQELHRILKETDLWDGKSWALQMTDLTEQTVQLRALMSAANAGSAFELRCLVRERLVEFIQKEYPQSLPRLRAEFHDNGVAHTRQTNNESPSSALSSAKPNARDSESRFQRRLDQQAQV